MQLLEGLGDKSSLVTSLRPSANFREHILQAVVKYSHLPIRRYLQAWRKRADFCCIHEIDAAHPEVSLLADFVRSRVTKPTASALSTIKALCWVSLHAGLQEFNALLFEPVAASYTEACPPKLRRESCPLPMSLVAYLERQILRADVCLVDKLAIGAILLMIWSSLRFADGQRVELVSMQRLYGCTRALCAITKTSQRGQPFAAATCGFYGNVGSPCWGDIWFEIMSDCLRNAAQQQGGFCPEFLLSNAAVCNFGSERQPMLDRPATRQQCSQLLRYLLHQHLQQANVSRLKLQQRCSQLGVHSMKSAPVRRSSALEATTHWHERGPEL